MLWKAAPSSCRWLGSIQTVIGAKGFKGRSVPKKTGGFMVDVFCVIKKCKCGAQKDVLPVDLIPRLSQKIKTMVYLNQNEIDKDTGRGTARP